MEKFNHCQDVNGELPLYSYWKKKMLLFVNTTVTSIDTVAAETGKAEVQTPGERFQNTST